MQNNTSVITVIDSINETTMPYNEFVLFRDKHYPNEKQYVFLIRDCLLDRSKIPDSIEIKRVGRSFFKIRKELKAIKKESVKTGGKIVVHLHCIRGSLKTLFAMIGVIGRKKTVYTVHSTYSGFKLYNKIFSFLDGLFARYVTMVSETSYDSFPRIVKKLKKDRCVVVYNGANLERIDDVLSAVGEKRKNEDEFVVGYVARVIPIKNHKFLLDVLAKCDKRIRFEFIGSCDENSDVVSYAEKIGVADRVRFVGLIPREEVFERLDNYDLYVSSSTLEGMPVSVLEAMYAGLPAVLSDIPQHKEVAKDAPFVKILPFDADKWAETLNDYAGMSKRELDDLGAMSRKHIEDNFSLEAMHKNYDRIYEKIKSGK